MKFVRFSQGRGTARLGILDASTPSLRPLAAFDGDLIALIEASPAHTAPQLAIDEAKKPLHAVTLLAPILPRRNVFCVGKNYRAHAKEFAKSGFDTSASGDATSPEEPIVFTKAPTSVIGPNVPIPGYLDYTDSTDYEGELAVVIGRGGRGISAKDAMGHVFGFTIANDVTARHLQQRHRQWFLGKSIDGFLPLGPCVVTRDEIADLASTELRTFVDGELRQRSTFAHLIFDVPRLIETLSRTMTLLPGDIIATGTPEGVGIGFVPPKFLGHGSVVRVEIDGIGALENRVCKQAQ